MSIDSIFDRHALIALEKMYKVECLTESSDWQLDSENAELSFSNGIVFPVQFIATFANTWLWADANHEMNFPPHSLSMIKKVRQVASQSQLAEFGSDSVTLPDDNYSAPRLLFATDYFGNPDGVFSCSHDHGIVHVVIQDERIAAQPDFDCHALADFIAMLAFCGRDLITLVQSYLMQKKYTLETLSSSEVRCTLASGEPFGLIVQQLDDGEMEITVEGPGDPNEED